MNNGYVSTTPVTYTNDELVRYFYDEFGFETGINHGQSRPSESVTTHVTSVSRVDHFRDEKGRLREGKYVTVRPYGVQGVAKQPVPPPPRNIE